MCVWEARAGARPTKARVAADEIVERASEAVDVGIEQDAAMIAKSSTNCFGVIEPRVIKEVGQELLHLIEAPPVLWTGTCHPCSEPCATS